MSVSNCESAVSDVIVKTESIDSQIESKTDSFDFQKTDSLDSQLESFCDNNVKPSTLETIVAMADNTEPGSKIVDNSAVKLRQKLNSQSDSDTEKLGTSSDKSGVDNKTRRTQKLSSSSDTCSDTEKSVVDNSVIISQKLSSTPPNNNLLAAVGGNSSPASSNDEFGASDRSRIESGDLVFRPESLSLPPPLQYLERDNSTSSFEDLEPESPSVSLERLESVIQAVTEIPLHEQGMLTRDGKMMSFVAEDLNDMIRMSSPLSRSSRTNSIRSISSVNSISSSSYCSTSVSGMSRSSSLPLHPSPDDIPPIDPHALKDIETHAKRVADNLDLMMGNLRSTLHKMSAITLACGDAYASGVDNTCESVDTCIKSMYALMAKCEEVSKVMHPVYKLAEQIKEIKRLLDLFENQVSKDSKDEKTKGKK